MRCPKCNDQVVQTSADGSEQKLRIKGAFLYRAGCIEAACFWCGEQLKIPADLKFTGPAKVRVVVPPKLLLTPPSDKA